MAYKYTHFIPQNTAPKGAKKIGVYDENGKRICTISLGGMTPPTKEKLYSFGVLSDIHLFDNLYVSWQPNPKFDNALTYFENQGCAMCVISGDLTQTGFYVEKTTDGVKTYVLDTAQMQVYKDICDKHTIPVYELCGNHESYYGKPITENLDLLNTYTGKSVLSYTVTQGDDLFVLVGQPKDAWVMSESDYTWLSETLEANKNKRCFVFIHSHIDDNIKGGIEDSGNPDFSRPNSIFADNYWGAANRTKFLNLMKKYPNAILFHGHSHMMFESQKYDDEANYTEKNGFKSVHVPSGGFPRELNVKEDGTTDGSWTGKDSESQGYIVDVYDDCIVLNGMDLINQKPIPLGVYKINTAS
jgi:hypothetical protein